jgi:Predicted membrane protein (DUF2207)
MKANLSIIKIIISLICCVLPLKAEEFISRYNVVLDVKKDSTIQVTESITVFAEGYKFKRGIYRDFPTKYKTSLGGNTNAGFKVLNAKRNGQNESFYTDCIANGLRAYLGKKDVFIPTGFHTYELAFETNRQLYFSDSYTELYFNAIGHSWDFPIGRNENPEQKINVLVNLPAASSIQMPLQCYTGARVVLHSIVAVSGLIVKLYFLAQKLI